MGTEHEMQPHNTQHKGGNTKQWPLLHGGKRLWMRGNLKTCRGNLNKGLWNPNMTAGCRTAETRAAVIDSLAVLPCVTGRSFENVNRSEKKKITLHQNASSSPGWLTRVGVGSGIGRYHENNSYYHVSTRKEHEVQLLFNKSPFKGNRCSQLKGFAVHHKHGGPHLHHHTYCCFCFFFR